MKKRRGSAQRKVRQRRGPSTAPKEIAFVRSSAKRATRNQVELIPGRVSKISGGQRLYWRVLFSGQHVGHVSIICVQRGESTDASIDVKINRENRGRGIGTIVFRRACELSGLDEVVATIRKGNIASRIAVERAGFESLDPEPTGELLLVWRRK